MVFGWLRIGLGWLRMVSRLLRMVFGWLRIGLGWLRMVSAIIKNGVGIVKDVV